MHEISVKKKKEETFNKDRNNKKNQTDSRAVN